jgi:hypothetical protein
VVARAERKWSCACYRRATFFSAGRQRQNSVIKLPLACWRAGGTLKWELIVHRSGAGQSRSELGASTRVWGGRIAVVEHQTHDLSSLFSITTSTSSKSSASAIFTPVYQDRIFCYIQLTTQIDILLCSFFSRFLGHLPFPPFLLIQSSALQWLPFRVISSAINYDPIKSCLGGSWNLTHSI